MVGKIRFSRWLVGAVILAVVECAGVAAIDLALTQPAQAQRADDRYPFQRQRQHRAAFSAGSAAAATIRARIRASFEQPQPQTQFESSRAPAPHKPDPNAPAPTTSIVVMGDGMADWLAYGLEDAFSDSPEIGIVRKDKINSGLLRYEAKSDLDWWHVARDMLAQEKPNYVVMMLGVSDRQNIRERDLAKEADKPKRQGRARQDRHDKTPPEQRSGRRSGQRPDHRARAAARQEAPTASSNSAATNGPRSIPSASTRRSPRSRAKACRCSGSACRRSAAPSRPPTQSISTISIARAPSAPASIYIDVWDGFVDEAGKYSNFGPDYEGQMRRLRSSDGVYFTKSGARKLAHYVEREIRRYMSNRACRWRCPPAPVAPVPRYEIDSAAAGRTRWCR